MLLLGHAALPGRIAAATVDHGLRAESADEAAFVAGLCAKLGIPHAILRVDVPGGNLQSEARAARYTALADWLVSEGLDALATAHHADDQAETFLMRANRASGLSGLAGIRAVGKVPGSALTLLRPLLGWRRSELADVVASAGLVAVQDPSNASEAFDRVRIRKALEAADWLDVLAIARSAAYLGDAEEALQSVVEACWAACASIEADGIEMVPPQGRYLRFQCVARAIATLGRPARGEATASLLAALEAGEGGNVGGVLAESRKGVWRFRREPARTA